MSYDSLEHLHNELLAGMERVRRTRNCDLVLLMLTQIIDAGTLLLYVGEGAEDLLARAFTGFELKALEHYIVLPGVMSRKSRSSRISPQCWIKHRAPIRNSALTAGFLWLAASSSVAAGVVARASFLPLQAIRTSAYKVFCVRRAECVARQGAAAQVQQSAASSY